MEPFSTLHIIDYLLPGGGAEQRLLRDLRALPRHIASAVLCLVRADRTLVAQLRAAGIPVFIAPRTVLGKFSFILRTIHARKPHIVHTQLFLSDILGRIAAALARVPVVVSTLQSSVHEPGTFYYSRWRRLLDTFTIPFCTHVIAVSRFVRSSAIRRLRVPPSRISVIPNYTSTKRYRRTSNRTSDGALVLCSVGKLNSAKGQTELLQALGQLFREGHSLTLLLAGEGPAHQSYRELAAQLGIQQNVVFLGPVSNVSRLLRRADAFVFPSHSEGLPLALLEAVLAKLPCVISAIPPNREVIAPKNCFSFAPGDAHSLALALKRLITMRRQNPKRLRTMVARAYLSAESQFNPRTQVIKLEQLYARLLRRAGGRHAN